MDFITLLNYVREAILEHLDDLEDLYLAEQRLINIKSGKTKAISIFPKVFAYLSSLNDSATTNLLRLYTNN